MSALRRAASAAVEGAFAGYNPRFQINVPLQAAPAGLTLGRFGWADPYTGLAASARVNPTDINGFVIPRPITGNWADWRYKYWDKTLRAWVLRGGMEATLLNRGDVWCRFAGGARAGQVVWANLTDGSALAADAQVAQWTADSIDITADSTVATADGTVGILGYELTRWRVCSYAPAGGLAIISTWSTFTP